MDLTKIVMMARQVRHLYTQHSKQPNTYPVSISDLHHVISEYSGHQIKFHEVSNIHNSDDFGPIAGRLDRYKISSNIFFASYPEITKCRQRYIAVKEMSHLIIDTPNEFCIDAMNLLRQLIDNRTSLIGDFSPIKQSETYAELVAIELLFPWEKRKTANEKIATGEITIKELAKEHMIPLNALEWILSDGMHTGLTECHNLIDKNIQ